MHPLLYLIQETTVSRGAADRDRRRENSEEVSEFFSEQMFSALICLSFLPWSILNFKEKSGRVILAELNSFRSHVVNKHTGLEYPSFSKWDHAGRHPSKEMIRVQISDPRSVWIMVHQRNRRIHSGHGFAGSFDAP